MLRSVAYLAEAFFAKLGHCTQGRSVACGDFNGVNKAATQSRPLSFDVHSRWFTGPSQPASVSFMAHLLKANGDGVSEFFVQQQVLKHQIFMCDALACCQSLPTTFARVSE